MQNLRPVLLFLGFFSVVSLATTAQQPVDVAAPQPTAMDAALPGQAVPPAEQVAPPAQTEQFHGTGRPVHKDSRGRQMGTVTEIAADRFIIKTEAGNVVTITFTGGTSITGAVQRGTPIEQVDRRHAPPSPSNGEDGSQPKGNIPRFTMPKLEQADIKRGDTLLAFGEFNAATHTLTADRIARLDPDQVRWMRETKENYGKTWVEGTVTAIDGARILVTGSMDSASYTVVTGASTEFRKRDVMIALADIHVGALVRVSGSLQGDQFIAKLVRLRSYPVSDMASPKGAGTSSMPQKPTQSQP